MTGERLLLLFLDDGIAPPRGWLRLRNGMVTGRGEGARAIPADDIGPADPPEHVIGVVPGEDVALHWVELPDLAPAQALAAARLLAAEVSAEPAERLHVAIGQGAGKERAHPLAIVSAARTRAWLDQAQALGFDPDRLVPEPLLIAGGDRVRTWTRGAVQVVRGPGIAFAAEPALAALALGDAAPEPIGDAGFEAGLADALGAAPVDLRQGAFARRRRWGIDRALARRLALLAGLVLLTMLAVRIALILHYNLAADRLERETAGIAARIVPGEGEGGDPAQALDARLAGLRGGGLGFSASARALFAAVRDTANVELSAMAFAPDGSLIVTATGAGAADLAALEKRLEAQGFTVDAGDVRPGGGRQLVELKARPR